VPFAAVTEYVNDGTNVKFANLTPFVGQFVDYAGSGGVPGWISACTVPPFLNCDGSTFSAVTYPLLAAVLGGTTLPDYRGRAPYFLNQGTSRLTSAGAGIDGNTNFAGGGANGVTLAVSQIPAGVQSTGTFALSITAILNTLNNVLSLFSSPSGANVFLAFAPSTTSAVSGGTASGTVSSVNANQQIVANAAPGIVGGIRMIRAG
jgi:hypothetical protein